MKGEQQQGVVMKSFVIAALMIVGCGGSSDVNIDADEESVCSEIAEVACHNLYQCCAEGEIENFLGVSEPRTENQCRDDVKVLCQRRANTLSFSIEQNRVRFDANIMNACLEALVAPDGQCADVVMSLPWTEACMNSAWIGTVATEGACLFNHDCAGGTDAFCAPSQKCAMRPTAGFPCNTSMPCASNFFCNVGTCAPRVAAGAPCTSSLQCQTGLFCDTSVASPVCTARAPGGAACTSNLGCASNVCVPGTCMGSTQTCFNDSGCAMRCANNPQITCTTAANCGNGMCSQTGTACNNTTLLCAGGATDVCVFPSQCLAGDCLGEPVCTAATLTVDYCTGALSELPLF
jgi:hypothetical protein